MSRHIREWKPGSKAEWRGPFGDFTYKPNQVCLSEDFCLNGSHLTFNKGRPHYYSLVFILLLLNSVFLQFAHIGLLACGTGIAPMVQVSRAIVENEDEETFVHCLYACRTQEDVLMKLQLDHFRTYWNFTITYALSNTSPESVSQNPGKMAYGDRIHYGRIDAELIEKEMGGFLAETNEKRSTVLICGTKSFDKDMINFLLKAGCTRNSYFKF